MLTQLCGALEAATDTLMSLQGLNERFNSVAVQLLHNILIELLQQRITAHAAISSVHTEHFCHIRVLDSTIFQLPDIFSEKYAGVTSAKAEERTQ